MWQEPKTNWQPADGVTNEDLNRIEGNILAIEEKERTVIDTAPAAASGNLGTLLGFLANMIKRVTGKSIWYSAPSITLEALKDVPTVLEGHIEKGGNVHKIASTTAAGFMSATDKVKLDGIEEGAEKNPTAQQILNAIKTVDGVGSGLDADTVRGSVPYTPLNAPCVFGKYVGSGASSRLITLGFSPEAVLVIPSDGILFQNVSSTSYWGGLAFRNNPCTAGDNRIVTVGTSGFYVYVTEIGKYGGVFTNQENRTFYYVAWKG